MLLVLLVVELSSLVALSAQGCRYLICILVRSIDSMQGVVENLGSPDAHLLSELEGALAPAIKHLVDLVASDYGRITNLRLV